MAFLYLTDQSTVLHKAYNHLVLKKHKETVLKIPCADVEHVMIFGNVEITTPALKVLAENDIEIAFFTTRGKLLFQLTSRFPKNIVLRQRQYQKQADPDFCLSLSQTIVQAKLKNAADVIRDHLKNHADLDCQHELQTIDEMRTKAMRADTVKSLLGIEGAAAAGYYRVFARMLKPPWVFAGRVRRPPTDPVNALLSFGYVIVANEIASHLDGFGFDPFLGFYHAVAYGRNSLALDLLEEFRHSLVDRFVLHLLNHNIMQSDDFQKTTRDGVYLTRDGMRKYFAAYEKYAGDYSSDVSTQSVGYFRAHFKTQAQKLAASLQNTIPYKPFQLR